MSELYKAIAGSPITYLAADISANQTTISIADDSALPDAPNICTIGYGENIETIRYGAKSNGVLQNVTRGLEGTPRAWKAGTEVARFFTAYDHNAIIENFNLHLAESASKHITESGQNKNGRYIKFDDGTMICRGETSVTAQINTPWGSLHYYTIGILIFPYAFAEIPYVIPLNLSAWSIILDTVGVEKTHTGNISMYRPVADDQKRVYRVGYIAIGRWK